MTDEGFKAALHSAAMLNAGSNHGAVCLACAITTALAESGAVDPNSVIKWAEWMADNQPPASEPAVAETASRMLRNFAKIMTGLIAARPEGFASRN